MLFAKCATPQARFGEFRSPVIDQAAEKPATLFDTPPGYLLTDSLAASFEERACDFLWVRLELEDRDPANFLLSLISSTRQLQPDLGQDTLKEMKHNPGVVNGWQPLFANLAEELSAGLPTSCAIVLEHMHHIGASQPMLGLLSSAFLNHFPQSMPCILIASSPSSTSLALPENTIRRGIRDLQLDLKTVVKLADQDQIGLTFGAIKKAVHLADGRAEALAGIFRTCRILGNDFVESCLYRSRTFTDLLLRITRAGLALATPEHIQALALAMSLNYYHADLATAVLGNDPELSGPWIQTLSGDWTQVRRMWKPSLRATIRQDDIWDSQTVARTTDFLLLKGAVGEAMELYFNAGDYEKAAETLSGVVDEMMSVGQWVTLNRWLEQIPDQVLRSWPWLIYAQGEISTAAGQVESARKSFAMTSDLFEQRHNLKGVCHSLLAESVLAAWQGDHFKAENAALAAQSKAAAAGFKQFEGWAYWHLGCLAIAADRPQQAVAYFDQAGIAAQEPGFIEFVQVARSLSERQTEIYHQRDLYRQAYQSLEKAEKEILDALRQVLMPSNEHLAPFLDHYGWLQIPMIVKPVKLLPFLLADEGSSSDGYGDQSEGMGLLQKLLAVLGLSRWLENKPVQDAPQDDLLLDFPVTSPRSAPDPSLRDSIALYEILPSGSGATDKPVVESLVHTKELNLSAGSIEFSKTPDVQVLPDARPGEAQVESEPEDATVLTVNLLGDFFVAVNDIPVQNWSSLRGVAILKYMLANMDQTLFPREKLMVTFWPDMDPDSARNNLNVALHSVRRTMREVTAASVLLYDNGSYRLNPRITVWSDVEHFLLHLKAGEKCEAAGKIEAAITEYEMAAGLYHGDFMEDDPYEEWAVLPRERLRMNYLDMLDRLSRLYFSRGDYNACINLCQLILEWDNCREDAYCLLMRCLCRQGQHHQALRQYQICVKALEDELKVEPAPSTLELADRIRRRECP